jgi:vitamin B12/bleomycin/antimicrobial peptide transport system ATP-binding/permease protein
MDQTKGLIDKLTVARFIRAVRTFANSDVGWKAKWMFGGLIALSCATNGLNVVNNYVGRDFITAIADRNRPEFIRQAIFYIGVFAACTLVSVIFRFAEERLGLLWRRYMTRRAVTFYLANGTYYRLESSGTLANPDQRIADDVKTFTVTTLSFVILLLNASFTVIAFSGVLWSISPLLFCVAVVYAACGSFLTILFGRPLVRLNYHQLDKEANFRSGLIHVRENAESVLLAHREEPLAGRLLRRLDDLVANSRRIIAVNRNVSFFTTGYNWMIQIIPALIVAPFFIDGKVEFGVITQSAAAFSMLVGAFSLIITQFQSISSFAAVLARLDSMIDAIEGKSSSEGDIIERVQEDARVAYEHLTLVSSQESQILLKDLSISIPFGTRVLISGSNEAAKVALFRASAGLATGGQGRIIRPGPDDMLFLAERPYLPPGTLRDVLVRTVLDDKISNDRLLTLLKEMNLEPVLARSPGLDTEQDWGTFLSLGEQQLLAFTRILLAEPRFVFVDRAGTALRPDQVRKVLQRLTEHSITYLFIGESDDLIDLYDAVLEIHGPAQWEWRRVRDTAT